MTDLIDNAAVKYNDLKKSYQDWIAALRSGKIQQGKEFLRKGNSFCCLGVLCDVKGVPSEVHGGTYIGDAHIYSYKGLSSDSDLPWLLRSDMYMLEEEMTKLWKMNDLEYKSFLEIADYIEETVMPLALNRFEEDYMRPDATITGDEFLGATV